MDHVYLLGRHAVTLLVWCCRLNAPFHASRASRIHMYIPSIPLRIVGSNVWSRMYVWLLSKFMVPRLSPSLRFGSPAPRCHRPFLFPRAFLSPSPSVPLLWLSSSSSPRSSSPSALHRLSAPALQRLSASAPQRLSALQLPLGERRSCSCFGAPGGN